MKSAILQKASSAFMGYLFSSRISFLGMASLLFLYAWASPVLGTNRGGIEFAFSDARVVRIGSSDYLDFDIMARGTNTTDRLGTGIVLINYNPAVFGYRVVNNNNLIVTRGILLPISPVNRYNLYQMDNLSSRLAVTYEYFSQPGNGSILSPDFQQLLNLKIKIQNFGLGAGLAFHSTGMSQQQYLDDNATLFSPVVSIGTITELIPPTPQISSITVQNSNLTLSWQAIPGCVYSVFSAFMPDSAEWLTEADALTEGTWTCPLATEKRFYHVTARSGSATIQRSSDGIY
jgi:hypothetical protein